MATTCIAIKADGIECGAKGKVHLPEGSFCLRHFNLKFTKDEKFRDHVKEHDPKMYERLTNDDSSDSESENKYINSKKKKEIKKQNDIVKKRLEETNEFQKFVMIALEAERLAREEADRLAREEAERQRIAAIDAANAHRDITFVRDPKGSIDLKAFAKDEQSIHRSSVQDETKKSVEILLTRKVPYDQNTLEEIIQLFVEPKNFRWGDEEHCLKAIDEITKDYYSAESFGYKYSDVCDRVWMFIKEQNKKDHTNHLNLRLASEILEGIGMCANGKMARLINILQGFDLTLNVSEKSREYFQCKMSTLSKFPKEKRKEEAMQLFEIFEIPKEEHEVWIDALMDSDD